MSENKVFVHMNNGSIISNEKYQQVENKDWIIYNKMKGFGDFKFKHPLVILKFLQFAELYNTMCDHKSDYIIMSMNNEVFTYIMSDDYFRNPFTDEAIELRMRLEQLLKKDKIKNIDNYPNDVIHNWINESLN